MLNLGSKRQRGAASQCITSHGAYSQFKVRSKQTKGLLLNGGEAAPSSASRTSSHDGVLGDVDEDARDANGKESANPAMEGAKKQRELQQTYLDPHGDGPRTCPQCGVIYTPGSEEDARFHKIEHDRVIQGIPFFGWKGEDVVAKGERFTHLSESKSMLLSKERAKAAITGWRVIKVPVADVFRRPKLIEAVDQTLSELRAHDSSLSLNSGVTLAEEARMAELNDARQKRMVALTQRTMLEALGLKSYSSQTKDVQEFKFEKNEPNSVYPTRPVKDSRSEFGNCESDDSPWLENAMLMNKVCILGSNPPWGSSSKSDAKGSSPKKATSSNAARERVVEMLDIGVRSMYRLQLEQHVVERSRNVSSAKLIPWPAWATKTCRCASFVYLFLSGNRLKGLLVVRQLPVVLPNADKLTKDSSDSKKIYAFLGVDSIWTHQSVRNLGVATTLVNAARRTAFLPSVDEPAFSAYQARLSSVTMLGSSDNMLTISNSSVAFSEPTAAGSSFARSFTGLRRPLAYSFGDYEIDPSLPNPYDVVAYSVRQRDESSLKQQPPQTFQEPQRPQSPSPKRHSAQLPSLSLSLPSFKASTFLNGKFKSPKKSLSKATTVSSFTDSSKRASLSQLIEKQQDSALERLKSEVFFPESKVVAQGQKL